MLAVAALSLLAVREVRAQYDPMFTQYMFNEMFINPAYAGSKEAIALTGLYRNQWVGIDGAPETVTLTAHAPLMNNKMGVGLSMLSEDIGVTNRQLYYASYAYRFKLGKGRFSFGLMAGLNSIRENLLQVQTDQANDPTFSSNIPRQMVPNFGFGMYYYTSRFYAGISIPRMVDNNILATASGINTENKIDVSRFHYYFATGYLFDIGNNFKLKPQVMVKAVQNAPIEFDFNVNGLIRETLWLGASYRSGSDLSALVGYQFSPQFMLSYSYDYSINQLRDFNTGSHEIVLNYLFSFRQKKIVTPRYF
ncbi:MAG: type IX secretion system membrane protein PorP/SprF [Bacteroidia bacterium]|jgi:type IX secretion system PorP/SprF family membrane protein|nr:type IX secretion system membrane protein PorP/SprF [Bacteroidia bacterium]